jgi:hypothetical protein
MPTPTSVLSPKWTDRFEEYAEGSPQMLIIVDLAKANPLEHCRLRGNWWEILANNIMVIIIERDVESIFHTLALLKQLQTKVSYLCWSDMESKQRLQGYIDLLNSALTHF